VLSGAGKASRPIPTWRGCHSSRSGEGGDAAAPGDAGADPPQGHRGRHRDRRVRGAQGLHGDLQRVGDDAGPGGLGEAGGVYAGAVLGHGRGGGLQGEGLRYEFIPFGSGRRQCPGLSLAECVVPHVLASLLRAFEWRLPDGVSAEQLDGSERFNTANVMAVPPRAVHHVITKSPV
jgi:hypothetical protein